jgi:ankyrin repeat protein
MDTEDREIILLFGNGANPNPRDEQGRTPLHDLAMGKGVVGPITREYVDATANMIDIFFKNGAKFDIKDNNDKTPLDLALEHAPDLLTKVFIKYTLLQNPSLVKPNFPDIKFELSFFWDTCKKEISQQLKTNLQPSTSSAAFFQTPTPSNSPTYVEEKEVEQPTKKPRLN